MHNLSTFAKAILLFGLACSARRGEVAEVGTPTVVELQTTHGKILLELSDKTPLHRDNFIQLATEGAFDSLLFHRVIADFVIQAGDPDSKHATASDTLGGGDRDYKVPAEFDPSLFHVRGALGAARDGNPERASSAMQFYIVQRGPQSDSLIDVAEGRINGWLAENRTLNDPKHKVVKDGLQVAQEAQDWDKYERLYDSLRVLAAADTSEQYVIPEEHRATYRQTGGVPHLDQNYTVFGRVIEGMDAVDAIAAEAVNEMDRPLKDVRILQARIIQDQE